MHLRHGTSLELLYNCRTIAVQLPYNCCTIAVQLLFIDAYTHYEYLVFLFCRFCDLNDFPGVIYDHECTGESNFGDPIINNTKDVLFSHWIQDVHAVIDQLTEGPIVLVGCSMGGKKN